LSQLTYEVVDVDKIKIVGDNPNAMTALQTQSLKHSIDKFDLVQPILIDQNNNLIDGHQRFDAIKSRGDKTISVIRKQVKDEIERLLLIQALNKVRGQHSEELDAKIYMKVIEADQNNIQDLMAFIVEDDEQKIYNLIEKYNPEYKGRHQKEENLDDLPDPETIEDPITKTGDLWQLGNHYLLCGDCTKKDDINKLLQGKTVDLLLTDPPYGINILKDRTSTIGGSKPITIKGVSSNRGDHIVKANLYRPIIGDDKPFNPSHLLELAEHSILFGANYYADKLPISSCWITWIKKEIDWERTTFADCELIWTDFDIPARVYSVIWMGLIKEGEHDKRIHPTQKPIKLMKDLIKDFSKEENIILDPYLGSGSTLIACEQTNRICYGIEIDNRYCDVITLG